MKESGRDDAGRFSQSVEDTNLLAAVRAHDPAGTSEIAEEVGVSRQGADRRLRSLREDGRVSSKKIGASLVWFIPRDRDENGGFKTANLQGNPDATLGDTDETDTERADTTSPDTKAESGATHAEKEELIDLGALSFDRDLTLPRREQLQEWLRHAADHDDGVSKSDFDEWWTDDRAGETGYNTGSFWEAFAKAAMKQSDCFVKPNTRTYRYDAGGA